MIEADMSTDVQEREELRSLLRSFLLKYSPEPAVRDAMESRNGYDPDVWQLCCDELELPSLIVPTMYGGMGYGWRELGIVLQEMGARVHPGPFLSTVFATTALLRLCSEQACTALLPDIATGGSLIAFAAAHPELPWAAGNVLDCIHADDTDGFSVSGTLDLVLDAHVADKLIVLTAVQGRDVVLLVNAGDEDVNVTPLLGMDQTRRFSKVDLTNASAQEITSSSLAADAVGRFFASITAALSAEQLGGAEEAFKITLDYLRTRVQFGRAIGSFQAVKHRCADMALAIENARVACESALDAVDRQSTDLVLRAHAAAALCSQAYMTVAREMMQLHGGVGFTWEHCAHLYLKRAKTSQVMLGIPAFHRRLVGRELGLVVGL
ncbi:acyl-CoA dehydrogenase family protein [Mycobacterium sp. smrl_JER01]|uniref:acyl-CoA dehydrogenase family protein n=1 Tax=Mycobacterium sp. smrl_JER01 TaxID=3402633 RepID=UPI003AC6C918